MNEAEGALTITVRVTPRSSRSEILGEHDGAIKVRLTAPPVDGAANAELIKLFSKELKLSKSRIEIVAGETSRTKLLRLTGVTAGQLRRLYTNVE